MERFTHLEFEDNFHPSESVSKGEAIRDEFYFHKRATACFLHGDCEAALRNYSRALEVNTTFFDGWAGQIWMLIELCEYPEAIVWADKAMELFPEHPELLAAKAVACLRDAKIQKAQGYSDNAIEKANAGPRVWLTRAEVLLHGKSRIADNCFSKAVLLAGTQSGLIRLEAGRLLRRYGLYSNAIEYLREAALQFPKSALVWYELGYCQFKLGYSQAITSFEQCLRLHPHFKDGNELLERAEKTGFFRKLLKRLGLRLR